MLRIKIAECKSCGKTGRIYAKRMCPKCYMKERQKVYIERKELKVKKGIILDSKKLSNFYLKYWNDNPNRTCFECGAPLYKFRPWHIAHIIPKRLWKEYNKDIVFNYDNIQYVCLGCHSDFDHGEGSSTPKLKQLKEILKEKFEPWKHLL